MTSQLNYKMIPAVRYSINDILLQWLVWPQLIKQFNNGNHGEYNNYLLATCAMLKKLILILSCNWFNNSEHKITVQGRIGY